jgi:hypothetical protein
MEIQSTDSSEKTVLNLLLKNKQRNSSQANVIPTGVLCRHSNKEEKIWLKANNIHRRKLANRFIPAYLARCMKPSKLEGIWNLKKTRAIMHNALSFYLYQLDHGNIISYSFQNFFNVLYRFHLHQLSSRFFRIFESPKIPEKIFPHLNYAMSSAGLE